MIQTEREIRDNKPFTLFTVGGKEYKVQVLPINKADDWLDLAAKVNEADSAVQRAARTGDAVIVREKKRAFNSVLYDCVFAYNPESLPRDVLETAVSPSQMLEAFYTLKELTDPFERAQRKTMAELRAQMDGLPKSVIEKALTAISDIPKSMD